MDLLQRLKLLMIVLFASLLFSCKGGLFSGKTPLESYTTRLENAGLLETAMGKRWLAAGETALNAPVAISIPYREAGYFHAHAPSATGLRFKPQRGLKLNIEISKNPDPGFPLFVEIYRLRINAAPELIKALDTADTRFELDADREEEILVRLQAELLVSGSYEISIGAGPSLAFPVGGTNASIGSFWGAPRGGGRRHEGIDIFASRGTPVLAAADGRVTRVTENRLGGLVVFMRPAGKDLSLYYAHLDAQLVEAGQKVKAGDTLGLVGNTGNAVSTPPHLHFGIYTGGGAIDPLAFVDRKKQEPPPLRVSRELLLDSFRTSQTLQAEGKTYPASALALPVAIMENRVRIRMVDGTLTEVTSRQLRNITSPLSRQGTATGVAIKEAPVEGAPVIKIAAGNLLVLARHEDQLYVELDGVRGWVSYARLN